VKPTHRRPIAVTRYSVPRSAFSVFLGAALGLLIVAGLAVDASSAASGGPAGRAHQSSLAPAAGFVPGYRTCVDHVYVDRIGVRFVPETQARVRGGQLISLSGADLSGVGAIAARIPGSRWEPRFQKSEAELEGMRRLGEARTRQALPDLNLFGLLVLPPAVDETAGRERLRGLLEELNAAPGVLEAWALPIAVPASIEAPASAQNALQQEARAAGLQGRTPDFSPLQGYLYDSPVGIWADSAWSFAGGLGQGVKVIDLEWGWLWAHEDLKAPFYVGNEQGPSDHGTAVLGEYAGQHNGYGVNGIAPEVQIGGIHLDDIAADVLEAISVLSPGDIYVMEVQVGGPEDWMPVEWWPDVYASILTGSALGVICCEAAGNGSVHLDDPLYGDYFDRRVRESGAIMVGAGTPNGLDAEGFSNYGSRLSLQGWGSSVVTTCCGDLQGGDPTVQYTAGFNGTSSATPIVTGAVASLQGQALALFGEPMTPALVEEILSVSGSPYAGTRPIGERPNLAAAREWLVRGYGDVLVTVRDGETLEPMPDMLVEIVETGRMHLTGPGGQIAMQLTAGPLTFHVFGDFFYTEADFPFVVEAGGSQEVTLDIFRTPVGSLAGRVRDKHGAGIANARVVVLATPLDSAWTAGDGQYALAGIPQDTGYTAVVGCTPTKGAAYATLDVSGGEATTWDPVLMDAETFESGTGGFVGSGGFVRGHQTWPSGYDRVPFSGENVWSTSLNTYYPSMATMTLTSPVYDMSDAATLTLSFHHWYWIETDDGGQVQVWNEATHQWVTVEPVGGYPDDYIIILIYGPGYNGRQTSWEPAVFRLDEWAGPEFKFRFLFKSNYSGQKIGWDIDDVALDDGRYGAVDLSEFTPEITWARVAGASPAVGDSRIAFNLAGSAETRLDLFDVRGALVRTVLAGRLSAGEHEIAWNGRDARGCALGAGMYFYRLSAGDRQLSGQLVRIR